MTPIELQDYLKLASVVKILPRAPFWLSYDAEADVVYINFQNPPTQADDSELTDDNVLVRYDESGNIIGLTILNASCRVSLSSADSEELPQENEPTGKESPRRVRSGFYSVPKGKLRSSQNRKKTQPS
ncbi:MAG TPA: DUF2283 domain-containing protein [Trichocoleus sp.]|jgi:uncharacterized protein YuzE